MKKRKTIYQRLTKKQQAHIRENFDGPPSRITKARILQILKHQDVHGIVCFECREIWRQLI